MYVYVFLKRGGRKGGREGGSERGRVVRTGRDVWGYNKEINNRGKLE